MNNFQGISEEQLSALLGIASKKLGKSEAELRAHLNDGNVERLTANLSEKQKNSIAELIKDPKKVEGMLSNPIVKNMLKKYMK